MKKLATICFVIGLLLIPSVTLGETYDPPLPDYVEAPEDTTTIANEIEDITGVYEPDVPSTPESVVESVVESEPIAAADTCTCNLDSIKANIKELYLLDDIRFEQIFDNYDYLISEIDILQGQIYELQSQDTSDSI